MKSLAIAAVVIAAAVAAAIIAPGQRPTATQSAEARDFVRRDYAEGISVEEATRLDPKTAVPTLLDMLNDPRESPYWSNVVITPGMIGDEQAVDPLIKFLEQGAPGQRVSQDYFVAKSRVLMALGYMANRSGS